MFVVPALLGIGCAAAIWFAARSHDADAKLLSIELAAMLVMANLLWLYDILQYLPALDWIVGVQALVMATSRHDRWLRIFILIIALRLTLHVVDYLTAHAFLVPYIHGLNALYALLLVVVSYVGGGHGRDNLLGHLHRIIARLRDSRRATSPGLIR